VEGWAGGLFVFLIFLFCFFGVAGGGVRGRVVWDEGDEGERGRGREGTKS